MNREARVVEMREAGDNHVLRVAGDRRGAADVAGGRETQQKRDRIDARDFGRVDNHRRQREAYDVVYEERGEQAGRRYRHRQHPEARPRAAEQRAREKRERSRKAQVRHDDHHPEQQRNRVEVDRVLGCRFAERAGHDHRHRARQRGAGAIDARPRNLAERDHGVGQGEYDECQEVAGKHRGLFRPSRCWQHPHQRCSSKVSLWKFRSRSKSSTTSCFDAAISDRAYDFYTRILGLSEERRLEQLGLIQLRAGSGLIDLIPAPAGTRVETGLNVDHVCIGVATRDLNDVARYLREHSVEVIGRAGDALWGAWQWAFALRARYRGQRRRAQADADWVVNGESVAGRIARLFSDKQDCRFQ